MASANNGGKIHTYSLYSRSYSARLSVLIFVIGSVAFVFRRTRARGAEELLDPALCGFDGRGDDARLSSL